jgi:hypothetical protein
MKRAILSLLLGSYHWLLRLYPAAFRMEAAEEGSGAVLSICLRETADFPANLVDAYRQVPFYPEVGVMKREASWSILPLWVFLNLLALPPGHFGRHDPGRHHRQNC